MEHNNKESRRLPQFTHEQRQRVKKYAIYSMMVVTSLCILIVIFFPKKEKWQANGFNTLIPSPNSETMVNDKLDAYQKDKMNMDDDERKSMMMDINSYKDNRPDTSPKQDLDLLSPTDVEKPKGSYRAGGAGAKPKETIYASANAYRDINTTLGNFYEEPTVDADKVQMREEIEELKSQIQTQQTPQTEYDDQVALLEKSYELAAKYMPKNKSATIPTSTELEHNGKPIAMPVGHVAERVVSALHQPMLNSEFAETYSQERNVGFNTAVGDAQAIDANTIKACINNDRTITDGQSVQMRLLEAMRAGRYIIPKNSLVTGHAKIVGERLKVSITTIESQGTIITVELTVYDSDGQEGIYIPGSMEINAAKEIVANMGSSLGLSINISTDAGAQIVSDLGKGLIQGTSQYVAQKIRVVKVHLKSGYKLMLYQQKK